MEGLLAVDDTPCAIYGDDRAEIFAFVDYVDYAWALQWKWSPKWSRGGRKVYLRRNVQTTITPASICSLSGSRVRNRIQKTLFLHIAIMERTGIKRPSINHVIVDHRDGDGLNCVRSNLRWATMSQNRLNVNGSRGHELGDW